MTTPTLLSPNVGNLTVGKGIAAFHKTGDSEYRDVGEVKSFEITFKIDPLDHFTQRAGIKEKDFTVILQRSGSLKMVMEEWTPANMSIMFMGTIDEAAVGGPKLTIMSEDATEGAVRWTGRNDVGAKYRVILDRVRFIPSASLNMISDEWAPLEVTGELLKSEVTGVFGTTQILNLNSES